jgi:hypothetical protein
MPEFDKLSSYVDEAAIKAQTDFFLKELERLEKGAGGVAEFLNAFSKKVQSPGSGTNDLVKDTEKLAVTTAAYQKILANVTPEVAKLTAEQKKNLQLLNEVFSAQEKQRQGAVQTTKLIKEEIALDVKLGAGKTELAKTVAINKEQLRQENLERTRLARVLQSEDNSRQKAQAIIDLLINKGKKLNLETEQGRRVNDAYNKTIERQNAFILQNSDVETKRIKNIGNYQGSAKIIVDALERINLKAAEVGKTLGTASPEFQQLRKEGDALQRVVGNPQFLNISAKVGDTTSELKFFVKQLNILEDAGQKNTQVYKDVQARLAQLTDQLGDTRAEIKALSSDSRGFDLFAGSVNFAADAFQTFAGAASLAGASEKDTAKAIQTLVAIQSVANGVKGIANELTTKGTAANKAFAFVQGQVAIATSASATATQRFGAALKLTGIGLLISGISLLVSKLGLFSSAEDKAKEAVDKLNESINRQREALNSLNDDISVQDNIDIEKLKQKGATESKIFNAILKSKQEAQKRNREFESNLRNEVLSDEDKINKKISERDKLNTKVGTFDVLEARRKKALNKEINSDLELLAAKRQQYSDQLTANEKNELQLSLFSEQEKTNARGKSIEANKKASDDSKAAEKDRLEKLNDRLNKELELEKRNAAAIEEINRQKIQGKISKATATAGDESIEVNERLNAAQIITALNKRLAQDEYISAIASEVSISDGKRVINEKTAKEKEAALISLNNKIADIDREGAKQQQDIAKENSEKLAEEFKKKQEKELEDLRGATDKIQNKLTAQYEKDLTALNKRFEKGKISQEDYNEKRLQLDAGYRADSLESEIVYTKQLLKVLELRGVDVSKETADLYKLERELSDLTKDKIIKNEQEKRVATAETIEKINQAYSVLSNIVSGALNASATSQKNIIEQDIIDIEKRKDAELKANEERTQSDQDRAANAIIINSRAASQKEQLERRQKDIDRRNAEAQKALTIFSIILSTAKAIAEAGGNPFKIALAAISGAGQLAIAIATPIPKFKHGRTGGPELIGEVGHGKREIIERTDGTMEITPSTPTLAYLGAGDKVHPDANMFIQNLNNAAMKDTLRNTSGKSINEKNYGESMIKSLENQTILLNKIANKRELTIGASDKGMVALHKWGSRQVKYIDEQTNW